mgnify:CR=1 FL=1
MAAAGDVWLSSAAVFMWQRNAAGYDTKTFREDRHRKLCSMRTKTLCGEARAVKKEVFPKSVHSHIQVWRCAKDPVKKV